MLMLLIRWFCCINLKYIGANNVLLKPGVYTPTLKKNQVVHDLESLRTTALTQGCPTRGPWGCFKWPAMQQVRKPDF